MAYNCCRAYIRFERLEIEHRQVEDINVFHPDGVLAALLGYIICIIM